MIDETTAQELVLTLMGPDSDGEGFDDHGDCQIISGNGRVISMHYDVQQGILLLGILGTLPDDDPSMALRVIKSFMGANFLWQDSEGETFAYDDDSKNLMMQHVFTGGSQDDFLNLIDIFDTHLGFFSMVLEQLPGQFEDYDNS